jgi:hypothetical protein
MGRCWRAVDPPARPAPALHAKPLWRREHRDRPLKSWERLLRWGIFDWWPGGPWDVIKSTDQGKTWERTNLNTVMHGQINGERLITVAAFLRESTTNGYIPGVGGRA